MPAVVDDARALLGRSFEELRSHLGSDIEAVPGDEYARLQDVTSVAGGPGFPGTLYLLDGVVELIYVDGEAMTDLRAGDLAAELGDDGAALRSRAGKQATLWVHAEQGVAFSAQGDDIDFLEVFRPRTQAAYESEIYFDRGAFIR